jgi:hypothetical protein
MDNNYVYDVFLSYKRNEIVGRWVNDFFYPILRGWLTEANDGLAPKIFFDRECIDWGDDWKDRLIAAVKTSRVLLAICSPSYFRSNWCTFEWLSFAKREQVAKASRLRIPVKHNDGHSFPDDVWALQMMDFSDCVSASTAFSSSPRALILEDKVRQLAPTLAKAMQEAPAFQLDWPVERLLADVRVNPGQMPTEPDDFSLVPAPLLRLQ